MSGTPCTACQKHTTASTTGVCWRCRPAPIVDLEDGLVRIPGLPPLDRRKAISLAAAIVAALER